jgi:hypothetical protein
MSSSAHLHVLYESHPLERLVEQVQLRRLHEGSAFSDPREWLIDWLSHPAEYLSGQRPADFLMDEDWDLLILSLLMQLRPAHKIGCSEVTVQA